MPNLADKAQQSAPVPGTYYMMVVEPGTKITKRMLVSDFLAGYTGGGGGLPALATPTLTATVISSTQIDLSWTNVANESSYQLDWSPNGTSGWTQIGGTIAANTITYSHTGLTASTLYYYRVKAVGDGVTYSDSGYGTDSDTTSAAGGYETESDAYFAVNTGLTTPEKDAVDAFIVGLKALTWSKFKGVYLPVWGAAADNKWNLVNPADTDGAGRLTFAGGITHAADGMVGNGTTGYADTHLAPSDIFTLAGAGIGVQIKTANTLAGGEVGANTGSDSCHILSYYTATTAYARAWNTGDGSTGDTPASGVGFFQLTRNSLTDLRLIQNLSQVGSTQTVDATGQSMPTDDIYIMAVNDDGVATLFSDAKIQLVVLHTGLSLSDAQTLANLADTLVGDLGI